MGGAVGIKEQTMPTAIPSMVGFTKAPWNKGRLIGQKRPLKPKEVWAIRVQRRKRPFAGRRWNRQDRPACLIR